MTSQNISLKSENLIKTETREENYKIYLKKKKIYTLGVWSFFLIFPALMAYSMISIGEEALTIKSFFQIYFFIMLPASFLNFSALYISNSLEKTKNYFIGSPYDIIDEFSKTKLKNVNFANTELEKVNLVTLPKYQETLKEIYQKDPSFFHESTIHTFKKENSQDKNKIENYSLYQENLESPHSLRSFLCLSLEDKKFKKTDLFIGKFEFIKNKKDQTLSFHSIEFIDKNILKETSVENFDVYLTTLLEQAHHDYTTEKNQREQKEAIQKKLISHEEKNLVRDFVEKMENTTGHSLPKQKNLSLLKEEIDLFETINQKESIEKI